MNPNLSGMTDALLKQIRGEESSNLFLVEHGKGLCCCHIRAVASGRIATVSTQLPYAQVEFRVPEEARLVGVVDLEIRSLLRPQQPAVAKELAKRWKPEALSPKPSQLGSLLRRARLRMGLSFRDASAISLEIADLLGDECYFIASGSLSDYETLNIPPRHFHKIVTFCAAYSLRLNAIFETLGLSLQDAGHDRYRKYSWTVHRWRGLRWLLRWMRLNKPDLLENWLLNLGRSPSFCEDL
jgi:hypothetical protein